MLATLATALGLIGGLFLQPVVVDVGPYSTDSTWDWTQYFTALPEKCPTPAWFDMRPNENPDDAACVAAAMRDWGASDSAVQFWTENGQFLVSFDEAGRLDTGLASSPWVNDGRGEAVLVNGSPSAMLISQIVGSGTEGWQAQPAYAELSRSAPNASASWPEYTAFVDTKMLPDGGQQLVAWFDMRDCRDCPTVAHMPFTLRFDANGVLVGTERLPPQ